jgi:two-component system NtrC family sensor kinase
LRQSGIEVVSELATGLPEVSGDPDQLHQVFVNLLINAMQAIEAAAGARRITLRTRHLTANGEVEIEVCDSGPGVPEHLRSRIFDPFFTTKPTGVGTGVGLSVCHGMVTAHGGAISVDEASGGGARFRVRLPQAAASANEGQSAAAAAALQREGAGRVLVIDDEEEIRELLTDFLSATGLEVTAVSGGDEALRRLREERFDAVVCDLRLPGMDGPTVYAEAVAIDPALGDRFVFATGDLLREGSQRFLAEVARPYLEKPFLPEQVRRIVGQVVAQEQRRAP